MEINIDGGDHLLWDFKEMETFIEENLEKKFRDDFKKMLGLLNKMSVVPDRSLSGRSTLSLLIKKLSLGIDLLDDELKRKYIDALINAYASGGMGREVYDAFRKMPIESRELVIGSRVLKDQAKIEIISEVFPIKQS